MKTVLVVDDTDLLRTMLHRGLRTHFHILTAIDATEAYALIVKFRPDAVILDIQMPGEMDGIALCEKVKADHRLRSTHILLATADADAALDNLGGVRELRANDLVLKPFSIQDIINKLNKALPE